jgi:energy-coupling factor transport system ATP-binding protein
VLGVLFQEAENQIFHSKVAEEVAFGLRLQKLPATEIAQRTMAALRLCQLEDVADAHPLDLAYGTNDVWLPSPVWKPSNRYSTAG